MNEPSTSYLRTYFSLLLAPERWFRTFRGLPFWCSLVLGQVGSLVARERGSSLEAALAVGALVHLAVFRLMVDAWLADVLVKQAEELERRRGQRAQEPPDQGEGG